MSPGQADAASHHPAQRCPLLSRRSPGVETTGETMTFFKKLMLILSRTTRQEIMRQTKRMIERRSSRVWVEGAESQGATL